MLCNNIDNMIKENIVAGYPAPYYAIPKHLGYHYNIRLIENYELISKGALYRTIFDHYVLMYNSDYTKAYVYSQPYYRPMKLGTKLSGWELIYTNEEALYNQKPMTSNAKTCTELWYLDISTFHLYREKNSKTVSLIIDVKLDESDRKFKNLIYVQRS